MYDDYTVAIAIEKKGGAVHTGSQGVVLASVAKYSNLSRSGKIPSFFCPNGFKKRSSSSIRPSQRLHRMWF
jgi:hypothetical protein